MSPLDPVRLALAAGAVLATAMSVAGCSAESDEPTPAVCSAVDALATSVQTVLDVDLDRQALPVVKDDLTQVRSDLAGLTDAAKEHYVKEIYAIELAADAVGTSLGDALSAPSPDAVSAVGASVEQLGDTLASLQEAVASTC
jgi:hypothetical protein